MIAGLPKLEEDIVKRIINRFLSDYQVFKEIDSYENYIYDVDDAYILRISHSERRSLREINAEVEWIVYLSEFIDVGKPELSRNEVYVEMISNNDDELYAVLFPKIDGTTLRAEVPSDELIAQWGEITARMHEATLNYTPKGEPKRVWTEEEVIANREEILEQYPDILHEMNRLIESIKTIPREEFGLIHNDLHGDNLLLQEDKLIVIDFDDAEYNYFLADIASILFHSAWRWAKDRNAFIKDFFPAFMRGYHAIRPIKYLDKLNDFIHLLFIALFNVCVMEAKLEYDEHVANIIKAWTPMLQNNEKWIELDFESLVK
ncbi:MAG: phosphotransferase [Candidatus Heimdallarchaeota archaeon]|nr:phosphotransferase [Candidatus Heimdallarchaeota archaeon]